MCVLWGGGWAGFGLSFSPSCILFGRNFSAFSNTLLFIYPKKKKRFCQNHLDGKIAEFTPLISVVV